MGEHDEPLHEIIAAVLHLGAALRGLGGNPPEAIAVDGQTHDHLRAMMGNMAYITDAQLGPGVEIAGVKFRRAAKPPV